MKKKTFTFYEKLKQNPNIKILEIPEKGFNYSKIINTGVKNADGDFILQLNNDTQILTPNWLELMIGYARKSRNWSRRSQTLLPR